MGRHRHPEGYVPPKPVVIFSRDLDDAKAYAKREGLGRDEWTWPRGPEAVRYLPIDSVAILPGFEESPRYDLLAPVAEVLEHENGPHVPTITEGAAHAH